MSDWVYILGERDGAHFKMGITSRPTVRPRLNETNKGLNRHSYVFLTAVRGTRQAEKAMIANFEPVTNLGVNQTEFVRATPASVEYTAWLRAQWFASVNVDEPAVGKVEPFVEVHPGEWLPGEGRRIPRPLTKNDQLIQDYDAVPSDLAGTAWSWMPNPKASFQDYFSPVEIVGAAAVAMEDIDLDAASHWAANRVLKIRRYFHVTYSAFDNPWIGRVWLNPPYGENAKWFAEILKWWGNGMTQLCMISPVWAFTTEVARPVMSLASAMVLLSPTPKFWGNENPDKIGSNHPHAVIYLGDRAAEFKKAFRPFGFPVTLDLS